MSANKAQTIASLLAARAAIDALLLELTEPLPESAAPASDVTSADAGICQHENRNEIKSFGAVEHWICADCGYEYRR